MVDSILAALIQSREKSIKVLEVEVGRLAQLASQARAPAVQASLTSVELVKRKRLDKLRSELASFREEFNRQMELPVSAVDPTVRKK